MDSSGSRGVVSSGYGNEYSFSVGGEVFIESPNLISSQRLCPMELMESLAAMTKSESLVRIIGQRTP
jgi:hypothetical protein